MQPQQQRAFNELNVEGVFDELFDQVVADIALLWRKAETAEAREELWARQRAVRDVRRAFKKLGGIDVGE